MSDEPCDTCGEPTEDALARTVRLSVDRANIDTQLLCPDCFADWIDRYEREMQVTGLSEQTDNSDIIID